MNPGNRRRPAAALACVSALGLLSASGLSACGRNPEKEALRAYEAQVESLVERDRRVNLEVEDLGKDLLMENAEGSRYAPYVRDQALPFYRSLKEKVDAIRPEPPRLRSLHARLVKYAEEQFRFFELVDSFFQAQESETMKELTASERAYQAAVDELGKATKGQLGDREALEAFLVQQKIMQERFPAFLRGTLPAGQVERDLRTEVLPRFTKLADRTAASRTAPGVEGVVARWAEAGLRFTNVLLASLPEQERMTKVLRERSERGETAAAERKEFLDGLKAYRESLR